MTATTECPECGTPDVKVNKDGTLRKHGRPTPCKGSGQPVGEARIPRRTQGFYTVPRTGEKFRSVTTILNQGAPKEALIHWAGNLVAETALDYLPKLVKAARNPTTRQEVYDWLRRAHTRKKDERAELGTAIHHLIEAHVLGQPIPDDLRDDPEFTPYISHFERFVAEWRIEFTASEMVVANYTERYAGTLDYRLRSPLLAAALGAPADVDILGDTKTGGELDERTHDGGIKGVYPEAGVQMAAYRRATHGWLRDGTEVELPLAHEVGVVLHLRPEGYRLYPVACGDDVFAAFLHIREVAEWQTGPAKNVVGAALTPPSTTTPRKAA